jgi:transposase
MRKHITIKPYLSVSELKVRYLKAKNTVAARQYHALWLFAKGKLVPEVSDVTGYCQDWLRTLVRRYNKTGETVLGDKRQYNKGHKPILTDSQKLELIKALQGKPADGGLWNGVKVALWIKEKTGRNFIYPQRGWKYLVNLGYSLKVPRPTHKKANKKAQNGFKKN